MRTGTSRAGRQVLPRGAASLGAPPRAPHPRSHPPRAATRAAAVLHVPGPPACCCVSGRARGQAAALARRACARCRCAACSLKPRRGGAEHKIDVEASRVDPTSVHGIWHSKKQAWAGIDRILPTGGRFGYEEYHNVNGNMAKLANYMKHARNELKTIEAHLPEKDKGFKGKEERKIKLTLDGERNGLDEVERDLSSEKHAYDKSAPQMLAQVTKPRARQGKRVFADNALYGEGIVGDIKSQGHHSRTWSRKGAAADMDKYFDSLKSQVDSKHMAYARPKKGVHVWKKRVGDEMDEYLDDLQVACRGLRACVSFTHTQRACLSFTLEQNMRISYTALAVRACVSFTRTQSRRIIYT